jgi:hypothetical protein
MQLFTQVCDILISAGYNVHTTDPTEPGLHVHDHGDTVTVTWNPEPTAPDQRDASTPTDIPGLHDAVRTALTNLLADAGLTPTPGSETGTLHITDRP